MSASRWIRPEVYPLFAAMGVAVGICSFQLVRNICINPEIRLDSSTRIQPLKSFIDKRSYLVLRSRINVIGIASMRIITAFIHSSAPSLVSENSSCVSNDNALRHFTQKC